MPGEVEAFYDSLASVYHLIFEDWDRAMVRQARVLDALLRARLSEAQPRFHDCACGIGTQAMGLASLGYRVSGSDLSPAAVQRAQNEAAQRRLEIDVRVADMCSLANYPAAGFDVVGALDNALPHLSVEQLRAIAAAVHRVLRPGGWFIASIRDYDKLMQTRPQVQGPSFFGHPGERRIVHQVWDWTQADAYEVHQYIALQRQGDWKVLHFHSPYRCLSRSELTATLFAAGFSQIEWLMPEETGYYQPIAIGQTAPASL